MTPFICAASNAAEAPKSASAVAAKIGSASASRPALRIAAAALAPSITGMCTSIRTASKRCAAAFSTASAPLTAKVICTPLLPSRAEIT